MGLIQNLFSRRWWWVTLIVFALMILLARLGVWQLNRLEQRRAANAVLAAALSAAPVDIGSLDPGGDISSLENRQVAATGTYDHDRQLILKVQNWEGRAGVHLITPLIIEGSDTAVLVDRGWIPDDQANPEARALYDTSGLVNVEGHVALSQELSRTPAVTPEGPRTDWYRVDVGAIQPQMPYELLPFYLIQAPDSNEQLPFRQERQIDLSEGSHLSYAIQWFIFSVGLGIAYMAFVNKNSRRSE